MNSFFIDSPVGEEILYKDMADTKPKHRYNYESLIVPVAIAKVN